MPQVMSFVHVKRYTPIVAIMLLVSRTGTSHIYLHKQTWVLFLSGSVFWRISNSTLVTALTD